MQGDQPEFLVTMQRTVTETAHVLIHAEDADEAKDIAMGRMIDGDPSIEWEAGCPTEFHVARLIENS